MANFPETLFLIAILCLLKTSFTDAKSVPHNADKYLAPFYLGSVDGKSFFTVLTNSDWWEAKAICSQSNLQLAAISSTAQNLLLGSFVNSTAFPRNEYWTAGRDALTYQQFVWDHNGETPREEDVPGLEMKVETTTCLAWYWFSYGHFHGFECKRSCYVLCELTH